MIMSTYDNESVVFMIFLLITFFREDEALLEAMLLQKRVFLRRESLLRQVFISLHSLWRCLIG